MTASAMRNAKIPRALKSRGSKLTSGFCPCSMWSLLMRGLQNLFRVHIVLRQQRHRIQAAEKIPAPKTTDGDGHDNIGDGDVNRGRERWLDVPEHVNVAHENQPSC